MKTNSIAIVGMAGRFPGARNLREFWRNLQGGVEAIHDASDAELLANGVTREALADAAYVKRISVLDDVPLFDAGFFGFSQRDAAIMDPQHRHFLECSWEALEDAGHPPSAFDGAIGVYCGSGMNAYLIYNLLANRKLLDSAGFFQLKQTGNDKDVLATRVSYQFDLRGPSMTVQTACSTSLVATHTACQSLLNFECDMALAGGVTIEVPHGHGYQYREGEILSRNGQCRAFDAGASGTVFGSGVGVVVLRRLEDALADGDHIHAVIVGSAINNDGARKVGFMAPSVDGQADVVAEALEYAEVKADEISYIETHGTGTAVGDPIEVRALTQAFRKSTARTGFCAIGSLKTNIGHLDSAAGVAGLIKVALSLENRQLPASLHYEQPNPHIDFAASPFYVNSQLQAWMPESLPRRAGVTSLGIGGTNAHMVLEEAPAVEPRQPGKPSQLLVASGKTAEACRRNLENLTAHLRQNPELDLADVAFTSQVGRQAFAHRAALVVDNTREALAALDEGALRGASTGQAAATAAPVAFLFSGQGAQYVGMGRALYEHEPVFRATLDRCAKLLEPHLGLDLRAELYPETEDQEASAERLNQTWLTQPALFAIEYSLAQWWMALGVKPAAMVGHSIGEYVAACLAGVFTLEDALRVTATRGRLMFSQPSGSMLAVPLPAAEVKLSGTLCVATVNHPRQCVVSGPHDEIEALEKELAAGGIESRRLHTSHAFHSAMMDPILGEFEQCLRGVTMKAPAVPFVSNVSGSWITAEEATSPSYWARHLRSAVRFADCLGELLKDEALAFVEVGPGNTLTMLTRQQAGAGRKAMQTLPHPREKATALRTAQQALGQLWAAGQPVEWKRLRHSSARRVPLPTYAFEHKKYWIEPDAVQPQLAAAPAANAIAQDEIDGWFYRRVWQAAALGTQSAAKADGAVWLVFCDAVGVGEKLIKHVRATAARVVRIVPGREFKHGKENEFTLRPGVREDHEALIAALDPRGHERIQIVYLWSAEAEKHHAATGEAIERCFYGPLYLAQAQALARRDSGNLAFTFVTNRVQRVRGERGVHPLASLVLGPVRVIPKEMPGAICRMIDVDLEERDAAACAARIAAEVQASAGHAVVAYRGPERFVEVVERAALEAQAVGSRLEKNGVYLITGGLGDLGLAVADHLARTQSARLVLVGRTALPPEAAWAEAAESSATSEVLKGKLRQLIAIRAHAGGLMVVEGDVADRKRMRAVVAETHARFGPIQGAFHAAGVLDDAPLLLKDGSSTARILDPKVAGALVLTEVLRGEPLKCLVLFSSISVLEAPAGQIDYTAANAFLDTLAEHRGEPAMAIGWAAWREIGMAARLRSTHPLIAERFAATAQTTVFGASLSQGRHFLISDHRLQTGKGVFPGTGYLEMAAAAFAPSGHRGAVEFQDVFFLAPLTCGAEESRPVRVRLQRDGQAGSAFSIVARDTAWREFATGRIGPCKAAAPASPDRAAILARCPRTIEFDDQQRTRQERFLEFGPRWRCLRRLHLGEHESLAELELNAEFAGDCATFRMHPALFDLATGCALYLIDGYDQLDALYLPISYKRLRVYRSFPARLYSHIRIRTESRQAEIATFDIVLFDEQGTVLAAVEGFSMRRLAEAEREAGSGERAVQVEYQDEVSATAEEGIATDDGLRAFDRILRAKTPAAIVVSPHPPMVDEAQTKAGAGSQASADGMPMGEIEPVLAGWWEELLGASEVGLDDDFFNLGGHSLIGVRLLAKIRKSYEVDLELSILFEARTVRQLAEAIRRRQQPGVVEVKEWPQLVAIQPEGERIPLFCVHAIGGDVLFYEQLARALGNEQPFYAFQSPLSSDPDVRERSVDELAELYVRDLVAFRPRGPYLLGGASYGGLVAYEMARKLKARGTPPDLLLLFDAAVPGHEQQLNTAHKLFRFWQRVQEQGPRYLMRKAGEKTEYWQEKLTRRAQWETCRLFRRMGWTLPDSLHYFQVEVAHWSALSRHVFKPYEGVVTLLRAVHRGPEALGKLEDPTLGWKPLALGGVTIHDVPTGHMSMLFEPYVQKFVLQLKTILPQP